MKLSILVIFLLGFPSLSLSKDRKLERLEKETARLRTETDPVGRTKIYIKVSEILLDLAGDAAAASDLEAMERRLDEYRNTIRKAYETIASSRRDPFKKPGGFKDLEIAVRRQLRQLVDMGTLLTLDQRGPVEKAISEASDIRNVLLKALFGKKDASNKL